MALRDCSSRGPGALSWPPQVPPTCGAQAYMQAKQPNTFKKILKKKKGVTE